MPHGNALCTYKVAGHLRNEDTFFSGSTNRPYISFSFPFASFVHFAIDLVVWNFSRMAPLKIYVRGRPISFPSLARYQTLREEKSISSQCRVFCLRPFVRSLLLFFRSAFLVRTSYRKRKLIEGFNQSGERVHPFPRVQAFLSETTNMDHSTNTRIHTYTHYVRCYYIAKIFY